MKFRRTRVGSKLRVYTSPWNRWNRIVRGQRVHGIVGIDISSPWNRYESNFRVFTSPSNRWNRNFRVHRVYGIVGIDFSSLHESMGSKFESTESMDSTVDSTILDFFPAWKFDGNEFMSSHLMIIVIMVMVAGSTLKRDGHVRRQHFNFTTKLSS